MRPQRWLHAHLTGVDLPPGVMLLHACDVSLCVHVLRQLLAQAERYAEQYYAEMCRRPAPRQEEPLSYAELCRRRGEHDRADQRTAEMFPKYAH